MNNYYKAKPLSRQNIRDLVKGIKEIFNIQNELYINVLVILEKVLPVWDPEFSPLFVEDSELDALAVACPEEHTIIIRQSVYLKARSGSGRDRFTIMHEIAHYILHDRNSISFARCPEDIKTYEDPEWQADAFAGEFLMSNDLVRNMNVYDISNRCGVTLAAAKYQYKK